MGSESASRSSSLMSVGQPAHDRPRRGFEARGRAVFVFEAELHDLELQRADRGEQRRLHR